MLITKDMDSMATHQNLFPLPPQQDSESDNNDESVSNSAAKLIRQKITQLYSDEPDVAEEEKEIQTYGAGSTHQKFIAELMNSGKNFVDIQTAWHNYYQSLGDDDKKQVWQEFYDNYGGSSFFTNQQPKATKAHHTPKKAEIFHPKDFEIPTSSEEPATTTASIKQKIIKAAGSNKKLNRKQHLHSLLFGLGIGVFAMLVVMFGFFNERFIAPFITPSKALTSTPIIIDPSQNNVVGNEPKIIIPKINLEIPVVYDIGGIDEASFQKALMDGVVHHPVSTKPGETGNIAIVGHSSNNLLNKGKYKFAFVLLSRLEIDDIFMLNYQGKQYIYKVYKKNIVSPNEVSILGPADKPSTATLITCDPPGTALRRLAVVGEQISPDATKNTVATSTDKELPTIVPGNPESLFQRLFGWIWD